MDKVEYLTQLMNQYGIPEPAQAALLGNIHVETGGTYDHTAKQKGGRGYGLFQFDSHKKHYKNMLKTEGLKDSPEAQIKYFVDTIYGDRQNIIGKGVASQLRNALETETDPLALTETLANQWFRPGKPHLEKRLEATRMYMPEQQAAPAPTIGLDELMGGFKYLNDMFNFKR